GMTVNLGQFDNTSNLATTPIAASNGITTNGIPDADTVFNIKTAGPAPVTITSQTAPDATGIYTGRITLTDATGDTNWVTTSTYASPYTMSAYTAYTNVS